MDAARRGKWIGFLCLGVTAFGWALNWALIKLLFGSGRRCSPAACRRCSRAHPGVVAASGKSLTWRARRSGGCYSRPSPTCSRGWVWARWRWSSRRRRHAARLHHADLGDAAGVAAVRRPPKLLELAALLLGVAGIAVLLGARPCVRRRQDQRHRWPCLRRDPVCARQRTNRRRCRLRRGEVAWQVGLGCRRWCCSASRSNSRISPRLRRGAAELDLHDARTDGPLLPDLVRGLAPSAAARRRPAR